jgi:hypothetical protein
LEVKDWDAEDFLEVVWGIWAGWVDLPAKIGGHWVPFHTEWPADGAVSRRIDSALRDGEDLYYSVAQFANRGRKIEDVLPASWLWADLDEVHPTTASKLGLHPTVAVESSPGRFQALWRLSRELTPKTLSKLNRALSYALDADRGGWDLTQVLRIPGTRNFKYSDAPVVKLLWYAEDMVYDPKAIWKIVKELVPAEDLERGITVQLPARPIPARLRRLLRTPVDQVVAGERSNRLWELECGLAECGLSEDEIFAAVWPCAWNKWQGVASGQQRLKREVHKAVLHVSRKAALKQTKGGDHVRGRNEQINLQRDDRSKGYHSDDAAAAVEGREVRGVSSGVEEVESEDEGQPALDRLPFIGYSSFLAMRMEQPKWMVEGIWTAGSHGIIGGEPKTSKTTLALALGLAVASGRDFLGEFPVHTSGPVLMVQEENAPWMMQDRLRKIAALYGLIGKEDAIVSKAPKGSLGKVTIDLDFGVDVPFRLLNNFGFDLSIEEHRDLLVGAVEAERPALVILDPLYMMVGAVNYDKAHEMVRFLKWLMHLRYEFNCAVAVIHHFGKQAQGPNVTAAGARRSGQRLLGSTIFHGWADTALYASQREVEKEGWVGSRVEREFRSMSPQKPFDIELRMGDPGSLEMKVNVRQRSWVGMVLDIVRADPGVTLNQLAEQLGQDRRTVLARLRGDEKERFKIEEGGRGRGKSHRIFLTEAS